jgi:hypothetical protein
MPRWPEKPEVKRGSEKQRQPANPAPPSPDPATGTPIEPERVLRGSFPMTDDEQGIKWEGMKSDRSRDKMAAIVRYEAERMGYVRPVTGTTDPNAITIDQVCQIVNVAVATVADSFRWQQDERDVMLVSADEQKLLDGDGRGNRIIARWIGGADFKYMDEVLFGLTAVAIINAKVQGLRALRAKKAQAAKDEKSRRPTMVHQMPQPTAETETVSS